jgi:hypothetical protein
MSKIKNNNNLLDLMIKLMKKMMQITMIKTSLYDIMTYVPRCIRASSRKSSMSMDNVLGRLSSGVTTSTTLRNFVTLHLFFFFLEPFKVYEDIAILIGCKQ